MALTQNQGATADIHSLLRERRSTRAYASRLIDAATLRRLFEAARWSPSASNSQPWRFIVATRDEPAKFETVLDALVPANREWAQNAAALIVPISEIAPEAPADRVALYAVGQAIAHLTIQAQAEGLYMRQMGGFDNAKAKYLLRIPDGFEPITIVAIGYLGEVTALSEKMQERENAPRTRKELSEFVFDGNWGMAKY